MHFLLYIPLFFLVILSLSFLFTYFYLMDEPCLRTFYRTFQRDFRALILYSKICLFEKYCSIRNLTIVDYFNNNVLKNPNKVCLVFEDEEWTYKQMDGLSNRIAHCFTEQGYQKGDAVALLMENCPDYICIWLGLAKIGVITALINTNNREDTLAHSLNIINMRGLIFGQNFAQTVKMIIPYIQNVNTVKFYSYARQSEKGIITPFHCEYLHTLLLDVPVDPATKFKTNFKDKLMYMYTSGTTGLPKAAVISHGRYATFAGAFKFGIQSNESHIFYNALPLYHITGGFIYLVSVLVLDHKMILRRKFSASQFWKEIVKHRATVFLYIGELCRYLLNQPEMPEETQHSVQVFLGSGLKSHLWKDLLSRFNIKKIIDHYGSTEANINLVNYFNKAGSIGIITRIFFQLQGRCIIKINQQTGEIIRDSKGFCIRCKPGEPGQLVGEISARNTVKIFEGYVNAEDSEAKIIRNCFVKGDMAYLTGDVLVMDEDGYIYFKGRLGDSFRWKGENVSLAEVENIISKALNFAPCIAYGVNIPENEGCACMIAIQVKGLANFHVENLYHCASQKLPFYAIPVFVRLTDDLKTTGTYKLIKRKLKGEGYNAEEIPDPLYMLDAMQKAYVPLTKEMYFNIMSGSIKF